METQKLVPTTQFINNYIGDVSLDELTPSQLLSRLMTIRQYTNFMRKFMNVGMFVPFDAITDSVLAQQLKGSSMCIGDILKSGDGDYELAKSNILFPGFRVETKDKMTYITNGYCNVYWLDEGVGVWRTAQGIHRIEDIANFGLEISSEIIFSDDE